MASRMILCSSALNRRENPGCIDFAFGTDGLPGFFFNINIVLRIMLDIDTVIVLQLLHNEFPLVNTSRKLPWLKKCRPRSSQE